MTTTSMSKSAQIGGTVQTFQWEWQNQTFAIAYETCGSGSPVLLLPAFSTVSTRGEMQGIAEQLAPHFQVVALDWLGFGQSDRPFLHSDKRRQTHISTRQHQLGEQIHLNLRAITQIWQQPLSDS